MRGRNKNNPALEDYVLHSFQLRLIQICVLRTASGDSLMLHGATVTRRISQ